jgi:hypothetical protein
VARGYGLPKETVGNGSRNKKHCPVHHIQQSKNLDARQTQKPVNQEIKKLWPYKIYYSITFFFSGLLLRHLPRRVLVTCLHLSAKMISQKQGVWNDHSLIILK